MDSRNEIRKERNKLSAAKSRANRKALFEEMARTIGQLRLENAALRLQIAEMVPVMEASGDMVPVAFTDQQSLGGFYDDPLTSEEVTCLMFRPDVI